MSGITITKRGVDEAIQHLTTLQDFKKLARQPVQDALDVVAGAQRDAIKRGPTGKAKGSIGTHIHTAKWGVYGNAGPRGGRFREGFVAALFMESGTGLGGPLHHRITADSKHVKRGRSNKKAFHQAVLRNILAGKESPSRLAKGGKIDLNRYNSGFSTGGVFAFPAYNSSVGAGSLFGARFGANANPLTKGRGKYKQQRFGGAGMVFARATVGMGAQPWANRAVSSSAGKARSTFQETLTKNIAEARNG
jgi:hypothetical protein